VITIEPGATTARMNGRMARSGRVQDAPEANATYPAPTRFCRDDDQGLLADVPAAAAFLGPSDEGLIDLHVAKPPSLEALLAAILS
jgi:hypothetical protein